MQNYSTLSVFCTTFPFKQVIYSGVGDSMAIVMSPEARVSSIML